MHCQRIPKIISRLIKWCLSKYSCHYVYQQSGARNESRIVGSLSEFAKDEPSQKQPIWCRISSYGLPLFKLKQNHSKSSSTSFILWLLIFRPLINLHKSDCAFAHDLNLPWLWRYRYREFINRSCRCYHCPSRRRWKR
jgi:hypothetical protein